MEFTLTYRGPLKANARPKDKHEIRRKFHEQLRVLWTQPPLNDRRGLVSSKPDTDDVSVIVERSGFRFAPLVSTKLHAIAELRVLLLRPEPSGTIITQGGDLDNRLKTLLDALKIPDVNAIQATPQKDEDPFFCLMESCTSWSRLARSSSTVCLASSPST